MFGGSKDSDDLLILDVAWTNLARDLIGLDYLAWHAEFEQIPADGAARVSARAVVGAGFDERINFEIAPPPEQAQKEGLANFAQSELFKKVVANEVTAKLKKDPALNAEEVQRGGAHAEAACQFAGGAGRCDCGRP